MNLVRDLQEEQNFSGVVLVFKIEGALDGLESARFLQEVQQALDESGAMGLVLVCDEMPYLTSSGLRSIMSLGKGLVKSGGKLVVCGLAGLSREIFTTSGFAQLFPVTETVGDARQLLEAT